MVRRLSSASMHVRVLSVPMCAALVATVAGCATSTLDSQWSDPAFNGQSLRGSRVYLVCEAPDEVLARTCQDRLAAEVTAYGATPIAAPARLESAAGRVGTADAYLAGARSANARAVLLTTVGPASRVASSGSSVGFGLGGFGFGSGRVGGGLGISLPIGGPQVSTTYGANTLLTDVSSGRLMWTANTSAPSGDAPAQVGELVKAAMGGAQKAGFF